MNARVLLLLWYEYRKIGLRLHGARGGIGMYSLSLLAQVGVYGIAHGIEPGSQHFR